MLNVANERQRQLYVFGHKVFFFKPDIVAWKISFCVCIRDVFEDNIMPNNAASLIQVYAFGNIEQR